MQLNMSEEKPKKVIFVKNFRWIIKDVCEYTIWNMLKGVNNAEQTPNNALPIINNNPPNLPLNFKIDSEIVQLIDAGYTVKHEPKGLIRTEIGFYKGEEPNLLTMELYAAKMPNEIGPKDWNHYRNFNYLLYFELNENCEYWDGRSSFESEVKINNQIVEKINVEYDDDAIWTKCFFMINSNHSVFDFRSFDDPFYNAMFVDVKIKFTRLVEGDGDDETESKSNDQLSEFYSEFYNKDLFTDYTIKCSDDVELHGHLVFLAHISEFFNEIFTKTEGQGENAKSINLTDVDSKTMKKAMEFTYMRAFNTETLIETMNLTCAAEKFKIKKLKSQCVEKLMEFMEMKNVMEIFFFAELNKIDKLLLVSFNLMMENYKKLKATDEWKKLTKEQHEKILNAVVAMNAKYPNQVFISEL